MNANEIKLITRVYVSHTSFYDCLFFFPIIVTYSGKNKESMIFRHTLRFMQVQYTDYKHTEKLAV